jgi:hypothetical protein
LDSNAKQKRVAKGNIFQKVVEGRKAVHVNKSSRRNQVVWCAVHYGRVVDAPASKGAHKKIQSLAVIEYNKYEGYLENNFRFIITKTPLQLQKFFYYSLKLHPLTIFLHSFHPH